MKLNLNLPDDCELAERILQSAEELYDGDVERTVHHALVESFLPRDYAVYTEPEKLGLVK